LISTMEGNSQDVTVHLRNFEALLKACDDPLPPAVLVFGGSSFMGRATVEALLARPARVCVVNRGRRYWGTNDPSGGRVARVIADRCDAREFSASIDAATQRLGARWDLVADFSAFNGDDIRAALGGLRGRFARYVYISSDSIYEVSAWASENWRARSDREQQLVVEADGLRPESSSEQRRLRKADTYGDGKLRAEEALRDGLAQDDSVSCRSVSLRLPDVIGPFDDTFRLWAYWHWLHAGPEEPPQVQETGKVKRKAEDLETVPLDPPLAFVFSGDVARFIVTFLDAKLPPETPRCDAVNLTCVQQLPLAEMLTLLASASGLSCPPPLAPTKRPRTFLPSVDRPWLYSHHRALEVYSFATTPLEDVLRICAAWFKEACSTFPQEARRAAKKVPGSASKAALASAGLEADGESSSSS